MRQHAYRIAAEIYCHVEPAVLMGMALGITFGVAKLVARAIAR